MADIVAETERLVLRRELPGDLAVWLEHMNTPAVMDKLGGVQSADAVAEGFANMAAAAGEGALSFAFVARKADGMLLGKCGLARIEAACAPDQLKGQVQIGWTLRADQWGHGYAREAAEAMLVLAFDGLDLATVYGQTSKSNRPSWRLMERLGMRRCAALDYPDPDYPPEHNPTMVYRLDAAAWRSRVTGEKTHAHV
jgi:RimJ/RimL family protein N-acetyltransferase